MTCDEGSVRSVESEPHSEYGDRPIQLPLQRSLSDAVEAMHSKGFTEPFTTAHLRFPLYWLAKEPEYAFDLPSRNVAVTVGVVTGEVSEQPLPGNS